MRFLAGRRVRFFEKFFLRSFLLANILLTINVNCICSACLFR